MGTTRGGSDERGAVLALLAILLFVFLAVAALAVDLSALETRGQTLQNTADAAALAGVAVWQNSDGDMAATTQEVRDLLRHNGVQGDDIEIEIVPKGPAEIEVVIFDTDPDVFLGGLGPLDFGGQIARSASARLEDCSNDCETVIPLKRPFPPTDVEGSGDGYYPVAVGDRLYAINHDGDEIACVDRGLDDDGLADDVLACWKNMLALPYTGPTTGSVTHTVTVDTRIFWTAQESTELSLFCWQTITESPCAKTSIAPLGRADLGGPGADKWRQRGGGVISIGSRIFVFTDDHRVRCVDTVIMATCAGYVGGRPTGLGEAGFAPLDPAVGVSGSNIDRVLNEANGQIYHTLHITDTPQSSAIWTPGVYLDCWDSSTDTTCSGFQPVRIHDASQRQSGRLFMHRTTLGLSNGVCSTGAGDIECVDLLGSPSGAIEAILDPLEDRLPPADNYTNGMGVHYYHAPTNRVIMSAPRQNSKIHCWSFTDVEYCAPDGGLKGQAGIQEEQTQDYGFLSEGNCIFSVGHTSLFWTFTADDMTPGCPGTTVTEPITPCPCAGAQRWGLVSFNFDIGPESPFTSLQIRVLDSDREQIFPLDEDFIQMVGRDSPTINLSELPTSLGTIYIEAYIEATDDIPWNAEEVPSITVGFRERPYLTE